MQNHFEFRLNVRAEAVVARASGKHQPEEITHG